MKYDLVFAQSNGSRSFGDIRPPGITDGQHHIWTAHRLTLYPANHHIQLIIDKYV